MRLHKIPRWLTQPSAAIQEADRRRQAQLLASLLIMSILLGVVVEGVTVALIPPSQHYTGYVQTFVALIFFGVAYGLSRTRHYVWGAGISVVVSSLAVFAGVLFEEGEVAVAFLDFLVVPLLLGSLFLTARFLLWLAVAEGVGLLIVPIAYPRVTYEEVVLGPVIFLTVSATLFLLSARQRDLLERDRRADLAEKEKRYRTLVEQIPAITYLDAINPDSPTGFTPLYVSPQFETWLGYAPAEYWADIRLWHRMIHPDDRARVLSEDARHYAAGETSSQEYRLLTRDGRVLWVRDECIMRRDEVGRGFLDQGILLDITERKRTEEELRKYREHLEELVEARTAELKEINAQLQREIAERRRAEGSLRSSEERFRQLAENIHEVFWMTSPEQNQVLYISPAYEDIWGRTCDSLRQNPRSFLKSICPEDRASVRHALAELAQGQPTFSEFRIVRPDGSIGWIWARGFPIHNTLGEVYRIVGIAEDVTDRKQAEEDVRKALAKERELGELKSRFISMASHEFRTPLSTILSSAEILEHYSHKLTEEKKLDYLHRTQAAVKNMAHMLNDVLTIGRADAGKLDLNPVAVDLVPFCRDLVEEMQLNAGTQHTIDFTHHGEYAGAQLDPQLLRQILTNLLSNAIKYSPQGGRVRFDVERSDGHIVFRVQDEGIGIPPEERAQLFETFHRARNVGNIPGTGLGLAIVKRSVDVQGGTVTCASTVGVGTTFTISLPLNHSGQENSREEDSRNSVYLPTTNS